MICIYGISWFIGTAHLTFRTHPSGPELRVRNFSRPWENPLNQEFLPKPILLAQNLELGEFWGKNDGFKGKFLVLENFLGSGKIPDPRFQTQIPDPMVGSGMASLCSDVIHSIRFQGLPLYPKPFYTKLRVPTLRRVAVSSKRRICNVSTVLHCTLMVWV